jgi:membrane-associated phospholipid phosphatase
MQSRRVVAVLLSLTPATSVAAEPVEGGTQPAEPQAPAAGGDGAAGSAPTSGETAGEIRTAQRRHRLVWRWPRFNLIDYVTTAVLGATFFYIELGTKSSAEPNWQGGILFDDAIQDALVASTRAGRERAGLWSDWFTLAPQAWAMVDTIAVPLFFDNWNGDVTWQLLMINLQAQAITGVLTRGGHRLVLRERPDVAPCLEDPEYHGLCLGGRNASFPSGHTSGAFVGAGLVCAHHLNLPLYGGGAADIAACAVNAGMATTSGVLRLIADRHYLTDVIVGLAIGAGAGFALPMLLHYRKESAPVKSAALQWTVVPVASSDTLGLGAVGVF